MFLQRRDPAAAVLMVNTTDATENLNADDFDFGVHARVDVSVARRLGECFGIEVRYFGIDQWSAHAGTLTTAGDLLQVNASPPVFVWADQLAVSDFVFARGIDATRDVFYHGAFVGLQYVRSGKAV